MIQKCYWALSIPDLTEHHSARLVEWAREQRIAAGCQLDPKNCWIAYLDRPSAACDASALRNVPPTDADEARVRAAMAESLGDWLEPPGAVLDNYSHYWRVDLPGLTQDGAKRIAEWVGGLYDTGLIDPRYWMTVCIDRGEALALWRALRGVPPASGEEQRVRREMLTVFDGWLTQARELGS